MKNFRKLTLMVLALMFVFPALVQFGSVNSTTSIESIKNYTESYVHHDQIWIQSNEEFSIQAAAESWAGDGSAESPYIITGYLFDCVTQPLCIWHTTVHWIFTENEILGVGAGIQCGTWIDNVTHGSIIDNEVHNRHSGLAITNVEDFVVSGNYVHDCWGNGIEFFASGMNSTNVQDNIIENIGGAGIQGTNTSVYYNSVWNVSAYAVNLEADCSYFSVKFNTFIDNGADCQVCDDGTSNLVSQNYYDDWSSPDVDAQGYVDAPYALDGDAENQDELPLAVSGVVPTGTVTTSTTTSTTVANLLPMDMVLIAGAVGAIILVAGVLVLKRRQFRK